MLTYLVAFQSECSTWTFVICVGNADVLFRTTLGGGWGLSVITSRGVVLKCNSILCCLLYAQIFILIVTLSEKHSCNSNSKMFSKIMKQNLIFHLRNCDNLQDSYLNKLACKLHPFVIIQWLPLRTTCRRLLLQIQMSLTFITNWNG